MQRVNLAVLDHNIDSIRDQVYFLSQTCLPLGIVLTVTPKIDKSVKNIIIEGLISEAHSDDVLYMRKFPNQFAMVLTEHCERLENSQFLLNGIPVETELMKDIDPNINARRRFDSLRRNGLNVSLFLTCGNLPELHGYKALFPNSLFAQLPWPSAKIVKSKPRTSRLLFSIPSMELLTPFRVAVLKEVKQNGCKVSVQHSQSIESSIVSLRKYSGSLDIGKSLAWPFDSPMRSYFSILAQRPRVNLRNRNFSSPISNISDISFDKFMNLEKGQLGEFIEQIPQKFENFVNSQNIEPLNIFNDWVSKGSD